METDDIGKLQKEIRSLKKQVERLEASRATFELMVDRNDKLLSSQLEQTRDARRRMQDLLVQVGRGISRDADVIDPFQSNARSLQAITN